MQVFETQKTVQTSNQYSGGNYPKTEQKKYCSQRKVAKFLVERISTTEYFQRFTSSRVPMVRLIRRICTFTENSLSKK